MQEEFLRISIRFESAWKFSLGFGWDRYYRDCFFEHEYHAGEYVMFPSKNFEDEYRNSPLGLCLAKSVRNFVKAKREPVEIKGTLMRAQFLSTPVNAYKEIDPLYFDITYMDADGKPYGYCFKIEDIYTANSIKSELGEWQVESSPGSLCLEIKNLEDKGLEPSLLAMLYMHKARSYLYKIRAGYNNEN